MKRGLSAGISWCVSKPVHTDMATFTANGDVDESIATVNRAADVERRSRAADHVSTRMAAAVRRNFFDLSKAELGPLLASRGLEAYRAKQVSPFVRLVG